MNPQLGSLGQPSRIASLSFDRTTPRTVVCEWTAEGTHLNLGDGPPANLEDFAHRVGQMVHPELR